jgi:hypothetical protein
MFHFLSWIIIVKVAGNKKVCLHITDQLHLPPRYTFTLLNTYCIQDISQNIYSIKRISQNVSASGVIVLVMLM